MAEAFTDADNFEVSFPHDLSVNYKMALLGAVFLIVSKFILTELKDDARTQ